MLNLRMWGGWVAGSKCVSPGRPGGKLLGSPEVTGGGKYCAELDLQARNQGTVSERRKRGRTLRDCDAQLSKYTENPQEVQGMVCGIGSTCGLHMRWKICID